MSREQLLATTFVELADTLGDDFDVVDFLQNLAERSAEILGADAAAIILADQRGALRVIATTSHAARDLELQAGRLGMRVHRAAVAASGLLEEVSDLVEYPTVVAGHFADNPASARVLVKAGFLYTGVVSPKFSVARGEPAPIRMMVRLA